jgi:opacity protein-like surface antigen
MASASLVVHRGIEDMRRAIIGISLGLALGAAGMTPALAGGDIDLRGSISPYGAATPVPAPIPVPVYEAEWYFRGDFAAGFGSNPSVSTTGTPFANNTGFDPSWLRGSFEPSFTGGVGVGYVWGSRFRTDFTVDIHSIMQAKFVGTNAADTLSVDDKTKWMATILLLNAYYDFRTGTPFTPYLGGGLGFSVNQLTRNSNSTFAGPPVTTTSADGRSTDIQFAAAAMAGVTYEFNSFVALDVNYRFLHIGGSEVGPTGANSTVSIGDLNESQIRAGLRLYIN